MKHGRLIDADALEEKVEHDYHHKKINRYDRDLLLHYLDVEMAPAIEPERKKGKWIDDPDGYKCSACGAYFEIECGDGEMNFCPNCGSDMRGNQDENN